MNKLLKEQSEIVKQRLSYHFRSNDGGWLIGNDAPFMKEFLNEVERLCKLADYETKIGKEINMLVGVEYGYKSCEEGNNLEKTIQDFKDIINE